jgi:hypothetical protein
LQPPSLEWGKAGAYAVLLLLLLMASFIRRIARAIRRIPFLTKERSLFIQWTKLKGKTKAIGGRRRWR